MTKALITLLILGTSSVALARPITVDHRDDAYYDRDNVTVRDHRDDMTFSTTAWTTGRSGSACARSRSPTASR